MDNAEVDRVRAAVPDASLTDVEASKLSTMGIEDIAAHHIQGDVALLAGPGNLSDALTAIGGHPVTHGLGKARQQPSARIAYLGQNRAPSLRHLDEIAVDVVSIALHDPIVRTSAWAGGHQPPTHQSHPQLTLTGRTLMPRGGNRNYRTARRHNGRRVECLAGCQGRAASLRWSRLRSRSFPQSRTASSISCRASSSFPRRLSSSPRTLGSR